MKNKLNILLSLSGVALFFNVSSAQTKSTAKQDTKKKITITKDPVTGVQYHFFKHDKNGKMPVMGDFASLVIVQETDKDSVIFSSRTSKAADSNGAVTIPLKKGFNGCLEQGVGMMSAGDSAVFYVSVDSLLAANSHGKPQQVPSFIKPGTYFHIYVKMIAFKTKDQVTAENNKKREQYMAQAAAKKNAEPVAIAKYFSDNNIHPAPTADSLFFIQAPAGTGTPIHEGDSIYVTYVGKLLNGTVFDQSANHMGQGPYFVTVNGQATLATVYSQHMQLIKAWIEALGTMHEGDKVTILSPSWLAYGPQGGPGGAIGPFSPLLFDMQVLKVSPHK